MAAMGEGNRNKGPWFHRLLVWVFGFILSVLVFWLVGYVVDDIGAWPGPRYDRFAETRLDPALVETETTLRAQLADTGRTIRERKTDQQNLRDGMNNSRDTMNEMRATYRLALDQKVRPTQAQVCLIRPSGLELVVVPDACFMAEASCVDVTRPKDSCSAPSRFRRTVACDTCDHRR